MINISFELDPLFLAYYMVTNYSPDSFVDDNGDPSVEAFQDKAWSIDKTLYYGAQYINSINLLTHDELGKAQIQKKLDSMDSYLKKLTEDETFKPALTKTNLSLVELRHFWENHIFQASQLTKQICRQDALFDGLDGIKAFMIHPSLLAKSTEMRDIICTTGGASEDAVYELWYALLNRVLPISQKGDGIDADRVWVKKLVACFVVSELRARIKKTAVSPFLTQQKGESIGFSSKEQNELLPLWKEYMTAAGTWKGKNISDFTDVLCVERLSHYKRSKEQS